MIIRKMLIVLLGIVLLAACSNNSNLPEVVNNEPSNTNEVIEEVPAVDTEQQAELTFLIMEAPQLQYRVDVYNKAKAKFEAEHPGVTINIETAPPQDYTATLDALFKEGKSPDIMYLSGGVEVTTFSQKGYLMNLNDFVTMDTIDMNDIYAAALDMATKDGQLVALPIDMFTSMVLYNKEWFKNADLPEPTGEWTWDEFLDTGKLLSAGNPGEGKHGIVIPFNTEFLEPLVLSNGGAYLSDDGTEAVGYMDSDKTVEAFQFAVDLVKVHKVMPALVGDPGLYDTSFYDGNAGMRVAIPGGDDFQDENIGIASMPKFASGVRANSAGIVGLGISAESQFGQLAWEYLKMISIEKNEFTMELSKTDWIPNKLLLNDFEDPKKQTIANEFNYLKSAAYNRNPKFIELAWKHMNPFLDPWFTGEVDIKTELKIIADKIDNELTFVEEVVE